MELLVQDLIVNSLMAHELSLGFAYCAVFSTGHIADKCATIALNSLGTLASLRCLVIVITVSSFGSAVFF